MADTREILYEGRFARFVKKNRWEYVERTTLSGIVTVVAVTDDRHLILTEQYRPPVGCNTIELPAGLAGDAPGAHGEELCDAARRELLEETGYEAEEMLYLMEGPASSGLTNEVITFFLARNLHKTSDGGGDASESITVHKVLLDEIDEWLRKKARSGVLVDPKVYAGIYFHIREKDRR